MTIQDEGRGLNKMRAHAVLVKRGLPFLVVPIVGVALYLVLSTSHTSAPRALPTSTAAPCQPGALAVNLPPTVHDQLSDATPTAQKATPSVAPGYYIARSAATLVLGVKNVSASTCSEPLLPRVDAHLGTTPPSLLSVSTPEATALPAAVDLAPGQQDLLTLSLDTSGACIARPGDLVSVTIHVTTGTTTAAAVVPGIAAGSSCVAHQLPLVLQNPA